MDVLELLRWKVGERPLVLMAPLFVAVLWARARASRRRDVHAQSGRRVRLHLLAWIPVAAFAAVNAWYGSSDAYFDPAEPSVAAIGWLFARGEPVYHGLDSAARYSHVYGPMLFVLQAWWLALAGPGLVASKTIGTAAGLASLAVLFAACRRVAPARVALALTAIAALVYLAFRNFVLWNRPEPLLLLCMSAALLTAPARRMAVAIVGTSLFAGVAVGLKISALTCLLPLAAIVAWRQGMTAAAATAIGSLAVACAPFAIWPNLSFANYVAWLTIMGGSEVRAAAVPLNLEWAVIVLLPVVTGVAAGDQQAAGRARLAALFVPAIVAGTVAMTFAASKPGAGAYYVLPLVPLTLWFAAVNIGDAAPRAQAEQAGGTAGLKPRPTIASAAAVAGVAAVALCAALQLQYFVRSFAPVRDRPVAADIEAFMAANPSARIAMGFGGDNRLSYYRPVLVFAGQPYLIDAPAMIDHHLAGLDTPPATLAALRRCDIDIWLVPKGGEPFDLRSPYASTGHSRVFDDAFVGAFRESYRRTGATAFFEVWECAHRL